MAFKLEELIRNCKFLVFMLIAVLICIAIWLFQYYQSIVAHAALQGVWLAHGTSRAGTTTMVINDKNLIFEWFQGEETDRLVDENATFAYKSLFAVNEHSLTLRRSVKTPFDKIKTQSIHLKLYPTSGVLLVMEEGKEVMRMVKDNQFTIDYFKS